MKVLALDYGKRRFGFAVGSSELGSATPLSNYLRSSHKNDLIFIKELIDTYGVDRLVVGFPLNMDGTRNRITDDVINFVNFLKKNLDITIETVDERLSSFEAEEILKSQFPNYKNRKDKIDSMAAAVILHRYFGVQ